MHPKGGPCAPVLLPSVSVLVTVHMSRDNSLAGRALLALARMPAAVAARSLAYVAHHTEGDVLGTLLAALRSAEDVLRSQQDANTDTAARVAWAAVAAAVTEMPAIITAPGGSAERLCAYACQSAHGSVAVVRVRRILVTLLCGRAPELVGRRALRCVGEALVAAAHCAFAEALKTPDGAGGDMAKTILRVVDGAVARPAPIDEYAASAQCMLTLWCDHEYVNRAMIEAQGVSPLPVAAIKVYEKMFWAPYMLMMQVIISTGNESDAARAIDEPLATMCSYGDIPLIQTMCDYGARTMTITYRAGLVANNAVHDFITRTSEPPAPVAEQASARVRSARPRRGGRH